MKPGGFPGSLSRLQQDLLKRLDLPGLYLTGRAALCGFYCHDRTTRGLDLFTRDAEAFENAHLSLGALLQELGAQHDSLRTFPAFRRYRIHREGDETLLDLVLETVPAVHSPQPLDGFAISLDTPEEIAVNKVCALVGRGEPRDLEDLFFLAGHGVDLREAVQSAASKDGGVGPDTLLLVLPQVPAGGDVVLFRDRWVDQLRLDLLPP